jgi:hypothetical protein
MFRGRLGALKLSTNLLTDDMELRSISRTSTLAAGTCSTIASRTHARAGGWIPHAHHDVHAPQRKNSARFGTNPTGRTCKNEAIPATEDCQIQQVNHLYRLKTKTEATRTAIYRIVHLPVERNFFP